MRFAFVSLIALAASAIAAPAAIQREDLEARDLEARIDELSSLIAAFDKSGDDTLEARDETDDFQPDPKLQEAIDKFDSLFGDIDNVPDDIANDDNKAAEYFYTHFGGSSNVEVAARSMDAHTLVARASVGDCIYQLLTSIPIAKIFKLTKLIKKAGGVTATAKKLFKCRSRSVCQRLAGSIVVEIFDMITNIPSIKKACIP